jgi:hypothetical protein
MCDIACIHGYKYDDKGCPLCACRDPPVCKDVLCGDRKCTFGFARDLDGCPSCLCNPCPKIDCNRTCPYGYKYDTNSGCPVCYCRDAPTCDINVGTVAATTDAKPCTLDCYKYGYVVREGCKVCACNGEPICTCTDKISDPIKCGDGTIRDYDTCKRDDATNICRLVRRECPVGIKLTMSTGTFTSEDLAKFQESLRVDINDIKFTATVNKDGKQEVTFWIERDALPTLTKDADVAKNIESSVRSDGTKAGYAYVIGESTPGTGSSATIIVSLLLLVLVILA